LKIYIISILRNDFFTAITGHGKKQLRRKIYVLGGGQRVSGQCHGLEHWEAPISSKTTLEIGEIKAIWWWE
jgi:hypothetical protein